MGRILKDSPYRVVIYGSGGWSHGFLTEKNDFLWPDRETDMVRLRQVDEGREEEWKTMTLAEVEDSRLARTPQLGLRRRGDERTEAEI